MVVGGKKMRPAEHGGSQDEIVAIDVSLKTSRLAVMYYAFAPAIACELIAIDSRSKLGRVVLVVGASR